MNTINRLKELMSAAARLPWRDAGGDAILSGRDHALIVVGSIEVDDDRALAIEAVNALPSLLATIARLESENAELRAARELCDSEVCQEAKRANRAEDRALAADNGK